MKIRFYCDLDLRTGTHNEGSLYYASSKIWSPPQEGYTRVAFDVELPLKQFDQMAEASVVSDGGEKR